MRKEFGMNILVFYILANLNHSDNRGMKPIHYAAQYDSLKGLKKLIDHGANPDEKDLYEESPLFIAAKYGMFSLCYQWHFKLVICVVEGRLYFTLETLHFFLFASDITVQLAMSQK